jgi:hypothetical protein
MWWKWGFRAIANSYKEMGTFFSLSKSATSAGLNISEIALLLFGLLLTLGLIGEYSGAVRWKEYVKVFEMFVIIGVAGELLADGGIFLCSSHLQTISDLEVASLNVRATQAEANLGRAISDTESAKARIAEAELELAKLRIPRTLDSKRLTEKLKPFAGTPFVLAINPVAETINFAQLISGSALAAKWIALLPQSPPKSGPVDMVSVGQVEASIWYLSGLTIGFRPEDRAVLEKPADALAFALEEQGFKVKTGLIDGNTVPGSPGAVHIVVGSKQ